MFGISATYCTHHEIQCFASAEVLLTDSNITTTLFTYLYANIILLTEHYVTLKWLTVPYIPFHSLQPITLSFIVQQYIIPIFLPYAYITSWILNCKYYSQLFIRHSYPCLNFPHTHTFVVLISHLNIPSRLNYPLRYLPKRHSSLHQSYLALIFSSCTRE